MVVDNLEVKVDLDPLKALLDDLVETNKQLALTMQRLESAIAERINIGLEEHSEAQTNVNKEN